MPTKKGTNSNVNMKETQAREDAVQEVVAVSAQESGAEVSAKTVKKAGTA